MEFPVKKMAEVFKVCRSCYYEWLRNPTSDRDRRMMNWKSPRQIHKESRTTYGSPRVHGELKKQGVRCSRKRVARIMRKKGLKARQKRKFKATTDSSHDYPIAPNLVNREFVVDVPNRVWVSDITYIWTDEGWYYLCVVLDLFSRMVVGWAMDSHITADLACGALSMAVMLRMPVEGLVFHSDRGVQYAAELFRDHLGTYKMVQSMSRKGDCWDNACAESFFATLKTEEVFHRKYRSREEARRFIFEYIAVFYNRYRSHSSLDFLSPEEYEVQSGLLPHVA